MTVREYLSDELASDSDDEKRIYQSESVTFVGPLHTSGTPILATVVTDLKIEEFIIEVLDRFYVWVLALS